MKICLTALSLLISVMMTNNLMGQVLPFVYQDENTCEDCPTPYLPAFSELPTVESFPDPFLWSDGRGRISNFSDWKYRRAEIATEIQHYEIGNKPGKPENIEASFVDGTLTVNVTVDGKTVALSSDISLPDGNGPYPAVIGMGFNPIPGSIFSDRQVAQLNFSHDQVTSYGSPNISDAFFQLYPNQNLDNTGQYAAWTWGVSRLIDGLELVAEDANIDTEHLAVSGCSYAGKMALFSGAFDERIALTFAIESGGGGYTTWRYSETLGNVETLGRTNYQWFRNSMNQFSNSVEKLPHDHHELMAMVAPRALFVTGNPGFVWLADESGWAGSRATEKVYEALGIPDRFAYSLIGDHNHCSIPQSQIPQIEAYVDKFLLGDESADTDISTAPFNKNLSSWIDWSIPELAEGTSYFGKTSLSAPENQAQQVDTAVTFSWNEADEADKYYIQLSTSASFKEIALMDSVASDTSISINDLEKGKVYYWRVAIKNSDGLIGPWSNQYNFATEIPLPLAPELESGGVYSGRAAYVRLDWNSVEGADNYLVELSESSDFSSILASKTTSNTLTDLTGTTEDKTYYWRVRANNIAGAGPWSEVSDFFIMLAPDNVKVSVEESNQIKLSWDDNSDVEEGYIVERKEDGQTDFSVIDTAEAGAEQYLDSNIESGVSYSYRIKAFNENGSSAYSEVALLATSYEVEDRDMPTSYSLGQNYPNPFNPVTTISFETPETADIQLNVFNMLGQKIETLVAGRINSGIHSVTFDASSLSSGIYFYTLQAGEFIQTKQLSLIK